MWITGGSLLGVCNRYHVEDIIVCASGVAPCSEYKCVSSTDVVPVYHLVDVIMCELPAVHY